MKRWPVVLSVLLASAVALAGSPGGGGPGTPSPAVALPVLQTALPGGLQEVFLAANRAYESGDFPAAAAGYQQLVQAGHRDAAVLYNLGNAWFRLGELGGAILAYEQARALDPADREILENLEFATSQIIDRVDEEKSESPLVTIWEWHGRLSPGVATVVFLVAWLGFNLFWALAALTAERRVRRLAAYAMALTLVAVLLTGSVLGVAVYRWDAVVRGVVLESRANLVSVPGGGVTLTTVHEGLRVRVRGARGDWLEVTLPNGFRGWLPRQAVGIV